MGVEAMERMLLGALAALCSLAVGAAAPQDPAGTGAELAPWSHVVVPQVRGFAFAHDARGVHVQTVDARVEIEGQRAHTRLDLALWNPGASDAESVLLVPVPDGAVVAHFDFEGSGAEPSARLLPRAEARRIYDEIVARVKDPALLEFAGHALLRTSVFPVPAGGRQRVRIEYEELLEADGARLDYVLPRSELLAATTPWSIEVLVREKAPIAMVYSPTHDLRTLERGARSVRVASSAGAALGPGAFRLSILREAEELTASLVAYPDVEEGGGMFLLMAGLPPETGERAAVLREVTVVLDRSGSMAGEKLEQARAAALQVLEALEPGEAFNVIDYSTGVASFAPRPAVKDERTMAEARAYLAGLKALGGTNLHDALHEALRQESRPEMLPLVLFLTDGLPTVGETSEHAIRALAETAAGRRRVFCFGVGGDVNVPLLDRVSDATRAAASYVLPGEDVELEVARVFRRLRGPLLASLELEALDAAGSVTTRAVRDLLPERLPDLFEGDQLVVLGRYTGAGPLRLRLSGEHAGHARVFELEFGLERASTRNAFVPRLWASRRIALLVDRIRQAGAGGAGIGTPLQGDPRFAELSEEILRLSTRWGILSEYTAFLATEGTDLGSWRGLQASCESNLWSRAVETRTGLDAVNQGRNFNTQKVQAQVNYENRFWDEENRLVEFTSVQQVCDRAFYRRGERWIDARVVGTQGSLEPDATVAFGSAEHAALLRRFETQGQEGVLALSGSILVRDGERNVLVENPTPVER